MRGPRVFIGVINGAEITSTAFLSVWIINKFIYKDKDTHYFGMFNLSLWYLTSPELTQQERGFQYSRQPADCCHEYSVSCNWTVHCTISCELSTVQWSFNCPIFRELSTVQCLVMCPLYCKVSTVRCPVKGTLSDVQWSVHWPISREVKCSLKCPQSNIQWSVVCSMSSEVSTVQ